MNANLVLSLRDTNESSPMIISMDMDLPDTGAKVLDRAEEALLTLFHTVLRESFSGFGTRLARQLADAVQAERGGVVCECAQPYRVDGEIGRVIFTVYEVRDGDQVVWTPADPTSDATAFAALGPREYYRTASFRELLLTFASRLSMRATANLLQRIRHQDARRRTPMTTVASLVEREGLAVQEWIERGTAQTLRKAGFADTGIPAPGTTVPAPTAASVCLSSETVEAARTAYNADRPEALQIPATALQDVYERRERTINISMDDVSVKKQKAHRQRQMAAPSVATESVTAEASPSAATRPDTLKRVHNTVAHVQSPDGHYLLTGRDSFAVLRMLIAFLCHHHLWASHHVQCFVDGARDLHAAIYARLGWRKIRLILDGFHLAEKCKVQLSLALKGRKIRNAVLDDVMPLLWLGRIDDAIARLRAILPKDIKDAASLEKLVGYFERNRSHIPCYALREALGLRNSSNAGEKANDLCVASRQKHNGMSWSGDGSAALASTTALVCNHELRAWCVQDRLELTWVA